MGRGRSGRVSASAASQKASTNRQHPQITDINAYGDHLSEDERAQWFRDNLGVSESQARTDEETVYYFTYDGFTDMHNNTNTVGNDVIDDIIDNPNSPVYVATQFRGLRIYESDMATGVTPNQFVENIISSGAWQEKGATSFSASVNVAHDFAGWNGNHDKYVSVLVQYIKPTTGMPIKHLSKFAHENEVLHSRKQMTNGYKIVNSQWLTGNRKVVITIADK